MSSVTGFIHAVLARLHAPTLSSKITRYLMLPGWFQYNILDLERLYEK